MTRLSKPLLTAGLLLLVFAPGDRVQAQNVPCGANCGGCGRVGIGGRVVGWFHFEPNVPWYVPYPYWWPQYFGPPYTDYQLVQYVTPPATTALMVKERILAINSANPLMLPPDSRETLPLPKIDKNEVPKIENEAPGKLPK